MAVRVGWVQADIDTLRSALASGVLTVTYDGPPKRSITYQSRADMQSVLAQAVAEVNGTAHYAFARTRKGFR